MAVSLDPGVSLSGGFNDIHEILGGKPLKVATDDFESLQNVTQGPGDHVAVPRKSKHAGCHLHSYGARTLKNMLMSHYSQ